MTSLVTSGGLFGEMQFLEDGDILFSSQNIRCKGLRAAFLEESLTCYDALMKKAIANAVENNAKPVKAGARGSAHLANVVEAKPAYSKAARQAAFGKMASHMPVAKAVSQAKLISQVDPAEYRIVRMLG